MAQKMAENGYKFPCPRLLRVKDMRSYNKENPKLKDSDGCIKHIL